MNRQQIWRRVRRIWVTLGIGITIVFVGWSLIAYRPSAEARRAIQSDSSVEVAHNENIWSFTPRLNADTEAPVLVFLPGSLVDPVAYAPLLRSAAIAGFRGYIVELPRRGAFGGAEPTALAMRIDQLFKSNSQSKWIIAGHSLGAVAASSIAGAGRPGFAGLIVIGSSHPRDIDLSSLTVPVTKIVGSRDGLASPAEVEANRAKLPAATRWVWIEGGNHSHFGWYGFQPGDNRATISADTQRAIMVKAVIEALRGAARTIP